MGAKDPSSCSFASDYTSPHGLSNRPGASPWVPHPSRFVRRVRVCLAPLPHAVILRRAPGPALQGRAASRRISLRAPSSPPPSSSRRLYFQTRLRQSPGCLATGAAPFAVCAKSAFRPVHTPVPRNPLRFAGAVPCRREPGTAASLRANPHPVILSAAISRSGTDRNAESKDLHLTLAFAS